MRLYIYGFYSRNMFFLYSYFVELAHFFFWLIFWIFGIKEIFGISTMIIGAVIGFILWIWITFFGDNGGHSDYEHEDMDHDMPIHVKIDN